MTTKPVARSVILLATAAGLVLASPSAGAVQTTSLALSAAPGSGGEARVALVHPADGARYHDSVQVTDRSATPLTVRLSVVGVTRDAHGTYQLGAAGSGLARDVSLGRGALPLAPGQTQRVPVVIRSGVDRTTTRYAAVTATSGSATGSVVERLAVLIELTPAAGPVATSAASLPPGAVAAGIALLALALAVLLRQWRRRRTTPPPLRAPTS